MAGPTIIGSPFVTVKSLTCPSAVIVAWRETYSPRSLILRALEGKLWVYGANEKPPFYFSGRGVEADVAGDISWAAAAAVGLCCAPTWTTIHAIALNERILEKNHHRVTAKGSRRPTDGVYGKI